MKILINHVGYLSLEAKRAVLQGSATDKPQGFVLVGNNGSQAFSGGVLRVGEVANWKTGHYWILDFSAFKGEGKFTIRVDMGDSILISDEFEIRLNLLTMRLLSAAGYYFKARRSTGEWLLADRDLFFIGNHRDGRVDAHGGWYDATGDNGIHLSHLSHSTYFNPQQLQLSSYTFFRVFEFLEKSENEEYTMVKRRMLDEGSFGADFLMRMRSPGGSFFISINRPTAFTPVIGSRGLGFFYHHSSSQFETKAATADKEVVADENYEVSLRSGGGLAIATLAAAARHFYPGRDFTEAEYVDAARKIWKNLEAHNEKYTNDGQWNLIDEYCALIAVTELYLTTGEYEYLVKSRLMYERIHQRIEDLGNGKLRLMTIPGMPFHHATDEGLPVVAMLQYAEIEPLPEKRYAAIADCEGLMRRLLDLTHDVNNPFEYPRLEHLDDDGVIKAKFFFPHNSAAKPWWQGDNARIASLSAAASLLASVTQNKKLAEELVCFSQAPLDWILGLNPFDSCMMEGYGKNNIQYFFKDRHDFLNCPGGIVNGITSGINDEEGIEFITERGGPTDDNWRWAEQWLPHVSWFMYALAQKA
jgi:hypothetical protein